VEGRWSGVALLAVQEGGKRSDPRSVAVENRYPVGRNSCRAGRCHGLSPGTSRPSEGVAVTTSQSRYLAYLLRLWRVGKEGEAAWRASLEDAHTGERQGFADLATLLAFLEARTERSGGRREPAEAGSRDE
jgi:hypothetical protein